MKKCPYCGVENGAGNRFCEQCGRALVAGAAGPADIPKIDVTQTMTLKPGFATSQAPKTPESRAVPVDVLFSYKNKLVVGRAPDCDICLPHPNVSRYHLVLERTDDGIRLRDLNSVNGVQVNGRRMTHSMLIQERERIGVGPFLFSLAGGVLYSLDSSRNLRLEARGLEKEILLENGQKRKLLENINLAVEPGEFVTLLGPSGSGKSTLMDCLNGRRPATGGALLANGEDFYRHLDSFRQSLGYVPQRDIVHYQLTVARALFYTARLRLPTDTGASELETRVEEVLALMELGPHRHTLVADLSGGQIKRVSLGAELLARPCLLYIDEATSGLDAGTEARMMGLFRQLSDEGRSVICITHNVDNVSSSHLVLFLMRGRLIFFGPPKEAVSHFEVARLGDIYDRLAEKSPEHWEEAFGRSDLHHEFIRKRLREPANAENDLLANDVKPTGEYCLLPHAAGVASIAAAKEPERTFRPPVWHQFKILTRRYADLILGDRRSLRLLLLQAPIVAIVVLFGFANKPYDDLVPVPRKLEPSERSTLEAIEEITSNNELVIAPADRELLERWRWPVKGGAETISAMEILTGLRKFHEARVIQKLLDVNGPVVPDRNMINPRFTYMLLFLIAVIVMWFGCNNAAKEIVKEEAIYGRERAVNLGILPYLGSKFLLLSLVSALQTFLLVGIVYGSMWILLKALGQPMPNPMYMLAYLPQYGVLVLLAMTGVAMGLLLSSCVATPDRANNLMPYVLIPQIILGGGFLQVSSGPLYWLSFAASPVYWAYRAIHLGASQLPTFMPGYVDAIEGVTIPCIALSVQMILMLAATAWFLRRKDVRRA
ncbi:MAG TPA: ATP-binding cassette domain-containing protein [Gemmataceae bacterium]|jgi:ABC-type multidrug transport system ATPase subunit|nr:ATP-binding cassette domain-containing protein [Gemmataceae bacterium]